MRHPVAICLLWLLALLPAIIFLLITSAADWRNTAALLNTLGRLAGVAGLSFMLVAAMLSSRVPGFDKAFGGLTKLWVSHHQLAAVSFLLLLMHPLLLAFSATTVSLNNGIRILLPTRENLEVILGWLALISLMVFLAPSFAFFGEPKYQRWKYLHKIAAVALILSLLHSFLLAREINYWWESTIWAVFTLLAMLAVLYRWGFSRLHWFKRHGRLQYQVAGVERPIVGVVEIELKPMQVGLIYEPGQFIYLTPYDKQLRAGYGQEHPFTLSSSPTEDNLRISVKDLGDASRALQSTKLGSNVRVEGPYGAFFRSSVDEESELWIAGGIGIAPFISRARYFAGEETEIDVHCFLCVQDEARSLYQQELQTIADKLPGFNFTPHFFYREGPLNAKFVQQHCPDFQSRICYLCGPPAMLKCVRQFLRQAGVSRKYIQTEEFNLL